MKMYFHTKLAVSELHMAPRVSDTLHRTRMAKMAQNEVLENLKSGFRDDHVAV